MYRNKLVLFMFIIIISFIILFYIYINKPKFSLAFNNGAYYKQGWYTNLLGQTNIPPMSVYE